MFPSKPSSELKIYRKECSSKSLLIFEGKLLRLRSVRKSFVE